MKDFEAIGIYTAYSLCQLNKAYENSAMCHLQMAEQSSSLMMKSLQCLAFLALVS